MKTSRKLYELMMVELFTTLRKNTIVENKIIGILHEIEELEFIKERLGIITICIPNRTLSNKTISCLKDIGIDIKILGEHLSKQEFKFCHIDEASNITEK